MLLVTLAEATPVYEASRLQDDLRRAEIQPNWWIINQSWQGLDTDDPVLMGRADSELPWISKVQELSAKTALVPWQLQEPEGHSLAKLTE